MTNLRLLLRTLEKRGYDPLVAESGEEALLVAAEERPHLILLDIMMPGIDGIETCRRLKDDPVTRDCTVVFMSSLDGSHDKVLGFEAGAVDYITKPFDSTEVTARVETHLTIHRLREKLQGANARMTRDLEAAARVQHSLLPDRAPAFAGVRFAWRFEPCDELAGDLLNIIRFDDHRVGLYVADVSGHGVPASLLSVAVHRSLSLHAEQSSVVAQRNEETGELTLAKPADVAASLNAIYPMESNGQHFVTLMYGILDRSTGRFEYVCAGHPGPVVCRPGEAPRSVDASAPPIGVIPDASYATSQVDLRPGDRLFTCSDGLLESRNADHALFGVEGLAAAIAATRDRSLDESVQRILDAASSWGSVFDDDVTLLALEIRDEA